MNLNFKHYNTNGLIGLVLVGFPICIFITTKLGAYLGSIIPADLVPLSESIKHGLDICSPSLLFGLILKGINDKLWKYPVIMKWLIDLPNLNGRYKGSLISSWIDLNNNGTINEKAMDCVYEIKQDASLFVINTYFREQGTSKESSKGNMVSGEIVKQADDSFKIYFIFDNTPDILDKEKGAHRGTSVFTYYPDKKQLKGDYFNDRRNLGTINVIFQDKKLLYRFE